MGFLLHHALTEAAERFPDRVAIRWRGDARTYARLERESNGVAAALIELGVRPRDRVGLLLPKRPEAIAALYGILKSGAAYVPLDPLDPIPHTAAAAADAQLAGLVSTPDRVAELAAAGVSPAALLVGGDPEPGLAGAFATYEEATADPAVPDPGVSVLDADLACLLYTSGSTGRPKGVMHTHHAALAATGWYARAMRVDADDRLALHAPLRFILSTYGIFPAAMTGAACVLLPLERGFRGRDLAAAIRDERISVWISVPAPIRALCAEAVERDLDPLRVVVIGGGALPAPVARAMRTLAPRAELWHFYGATEAWGVFHHRLDEIPEDDGAVPIGRPQGNTEVLVLTARASRPPRGRRASSTSAARR